MYRCNVGAPLKIHLIRRASAAPSPQEEGFLAAHRHCADTFTAAARCRGCWQNRDPAASRECRANFLSRSRRAKRYGFCHFFDTGIPQKMYRYNVGAPLKIHLIRRPMAGTFPSRGRQGAAKNFAPNRHNNCVPATPQSAPLTQGSRSQPRSAKRCGFRRCSEPGRRNICIRSCVKASLKKRICRRGRGARRGCPARRRGRAR